MHMETHSSPSSLGQAYLSKSTRFWRTQAKLLVWDPGTPRQKAVKCLVFGMAESSCTSKKTVDGTTGTSPSCFGSTDWHLIEPRNWCRAPLANSASFMSIHSFRLGRSLTELWTWISHLWLQSLGSNTWLLIKLVLWPRESDSCWPS